jgi:hypothetical protein
MSLLDKFASIARDLAAERATAAASLEYLRQQLDELDSAPLPKRDVISQLEQSIDAQLDAFDANIVAAVQAVMHRPTLDLGAVKFPIIEAMNGPAGIDARLVVALLSDVAKSRVTKVIGEMDWPDAGPPAKDRPKLRAKLREEIATTSAVLEQINAALSQANIQVSGVN